MVLETFSLLQTYIEIIEGRPGLPSGGKIALGKIDALMVEAVDNCCASAVSHYGIKVSIGFMNVPVDKIPGFPFLK